MPGDAIPTVTRPHRRARKHITAIEGPHPIDVHVGRRILLRRKLLGLTQAALARHLGVSFQQVQKYEKGANRVSASMLLQAAQILRVPVGFFFDDYRYEGEEAPGEEAESDPLHSSLALRLLAALKRLSRDQQDRLLALVETIRR